MRYLIIVTIFLGLILLAQNNADAALCAFRNPDRDTYRLFPEATGYRSVIKTIDTKAKTAVEEFLGLPLDYDEGGEHTFYLVLKNEEAIGIIRPHAERGKYGIIEMVWAFTLDGKIIDFLIQRSRERGTAELKKDAFRGQFKGKSLSDSFTIPKTKEIDREVINPIEEAIAGSSSVAYSAKKNLFLYRYFFPEYRTVSIESPDTQTDTDVRQ